jgi:hypothetical protein
LSLLSFFFRFLSNCVEKAKLGLDGLCF